MSVGKLYMTSASPPVRAVLLTEKAMGIKFEHEEVTLLQGDHLKPGYVQLNPQHTVPMYVDQDGSKIVDSHAIITYLVGKYGKDDSLYPKDLYKRSVVDHRLHFDSGLFVLLRTIVVGFLKKGWKTLDSNIVEEVKSSYGFLNKFLEGETFMAGSQLTVADFSLLTTVSGLNHLIPIDAKEHPDLSKWLGRCQEWPFISVHKEGFEKLKAMMDSFAISK